MTLLAVLLAITLLFGLWLKLKDLLKAGWCVVCLAVSSTWLGLFVAYRAGWFTDPLLLALLMGMSVTGLYYWLEKQTPKMLLLFRLPALLTLAYLFYSALTWRVQVPAGLFLVGLWVIFGTIYSLRTASGIKHAVKKLIDCCSNW